MTRDGHGSTLPGLSPPERDLLRWAIDFRRRMLVERSHAACSGCGTERPNVSTGCRACNNYQAHLKKRERVRAGDLGRMRHGVRSTAKAGCSCEECRQVETDYRRKRRMSA